MATIEPLLPDDYGQVYVRSADGIRCVITTTDICAQYDVFAEAPQIDGQSANGVRVSSEGELTWVLGDLGDIPVIDLSGTYEYTANGWDFTSRDGALRLVHAGTGHGVLVTIQGATLLPPPAG